MWQFRRSLVLGSVLLLVAFVVAGALRFSRKAESAKVAPAIALSTPATLSTAMRRVPGGTLSQGPFRQAGYTSLAETVIEPFEADACEVTNRRFAAFVRASGYRTTAEQRGWSMVFNAQLRAWEKSLGASWRRPAGPDSSILGRDDYPVVHVSWYDAQAFAEWESKQLPTVDQWQWAARGGLRDPQFPWGRDERTGDRYPANYWQGWFPERDLAHDRYAGLAPVAQYAANRYGLFDLGGNVWEWCVDAHPRNNAERPQDVRALRGGSWTSAANYQPGYRLDFERSESPDASFQDVGFRCVR